MFFFMAKDVLIKSSAPPIVRADGLQFFCHRPTPPAAHPFILSIAIDKIFFVLAVLYKRSKMGTILSKNLFLGQKIKQNSLIIYIPINAYPSRLQKIRFPEKLSNIGFL